MMPNGVIFLCFAFSFLFFLFLETRVGVQDTAGNVAWANDNKTLFYVTKDKLDRPFKVRPHCFVLPDTQSPELLGH